MFQIIKFKLWEWGKCYKKIFLYSALQITNNIEVVYAWRRRRRIDKKKL